jgi:hypothetical protein
MVPPWNSKRREEPMHLHKIIGYGLTDLRTSDNTGRWLDDPRINPDSRLLNSGTRVDADGLMRL